ncbi:flagellar biosynthetic protein FliO [Gracilibacillus xinjiangensis]|uniref:Flagellar biosynthetic protein FliO n=1 Tax=Gracilibacillus xinjiangensis TaxID=1193282 RepID=A0ABV8WZL8_9BACI
MKRVFMLLVVLLVFLCCYSHPSYASQNVFEKYNGSMEESDEDVDNSQQLTEENSLPTMESPSFIGSLLQLLVALAIVVGLIYFIANFVKKRNKFSGRNQVIENYGGISFNTNKSLQIVRIGERFFVIGLADNIELLLEITDIETIEQIKKSSDIQTQPLDFVKDKMKMNQKNAKTSTTKDFGHLFNKELDEMKEGRKKMLKKMKEIEKDHDH